MSTTSIEIALVVVTDSRAGRYFQLEIEDKLSGTRVITARLSFEQVGALIAGTAVDVSADFNGERVGLVCVPYQFFVTIPKVLDRRDIDPNVVRDQFNLRVMEYRMETSDERYNLNDQQEWPFYPRLDDAGNHHRRVYDKEHNAIVTMQAYRFLPADHPHAIKWLAEKHALGDADIPEPIRRKELKRGRR